MGRDLAAPPLPAFAAALPRVVLGQQRRPLYRGGGIGRRARSHALREGARLVRIPGLAARAMGPVARPPAHAARAVRPARLRRDARGAELRFVGAHALRLATSPAARAARGSGPRIRAGMAPAALSRARGGP